MKKPIWFPIREGITSRQAHCDMPAGTYEREAGRDGFFGPATHFHHTHAPTGWTEWDGPLQPRAFDLNKLETAETSPWRATTFLHNQQAKLRFWRLGASMDHLVRNADGDELMFLHQGRAELFCDYGHLSLEAGDYLVIPRGTMWRLEVVEPVTALLIEATEDAFVLPDKGIVGDHAIFDPAVLDHPHLDDAFKAQQGETPWKVVVKRLGQLTSISYPFNPLDAIGWHGNLAPVRLNMRDIRPLMSHRFHLPPSAHTTFLTRGFVVCTFAPRPIESDPGALKVPFYHNNDEYDEVIFYHAGDFFSRDNIKPGMVTFHPCGFTHGPHPKAFAAGAKAARKETDEYAVMIDTRFPLQFTPEAESVSLKDYVYSWKVKAD